MKKIINNEILKNDIKMLEFDNEIYDKLKFNEINTVGMLCNNTRKKLRELNFVQQDIQIIIAKLQLQGLDIRGNEY